MACAICFSIFWFMVVPFFEENDHLEEGGRGVITVKTRRGLFGNALFAASPTVGRGAVLVSAVLTAGLEGIIRPRTSFSTVR